jgi:hypothetical protein
MADLGEPGVGENAAAADMELTPGDLLPGLRDHRVALERTGTPLTGEVDGSARERTADTSPPEARAGDETGRRPDAFVGLVFRSARPGDTAQAHVGGAGLDRAPADRLAVEVRQESACRVCVWLTAAGLAGTIMT